MPAQPNFQFNSSTPGGGAQTAGYNYAMKQLGNSLDASKNTTQAGQMQLQNQLQQNQSGIQQNLTNRGLGNTTVSNTMQQLPMQTYNLGMAQLSDLGNMRQMGAYQNLANAAMQGGNAISGMNQPYAQTQYMQNMMGHQQGIPNAPPPPGSAGTMMDQFGGMGGMPGYTQPIHTQGTDQQSGQNLNQYQNLLGAMYMGPGSGSNNLGGGGGMQFDAPGTGRAASSPVFNGAFMDWQD